MARHIAIVDSLKDWPLHLPGLEAMAATDYLRGPAIPTSTRIVNLCRSYRYASTG